jgi:hypothetical protein
MVSPFKMFHRFSQPLSIVPIETLSSKWFNNEVVHPTSQTIADADSATADTNPGYVLSAQNQLFPQALRLEPGLRPGLSESRLRGAREPSCLHREVFFPVVAYFVFTGDFSDCCICSDSD